MITTQDFEDIEETIAAIRKSITDCDVRESWWLEKFFALPWPAANEKQERALAMHQRRIQAIRRDRKSLEIRLAAWESRKRSRAALTTEKAA